MTPRTDRRSPDRYADDVLGGTATHGGRPRSESVTLDIGLVVEDATGGWCGAVVGWDPDAVELEDRHGRRRLFPLGPGYLLDGRPVSLTLPRTAPRPPARSASGSVRVEQRRARVARASRILVEGRHDADLVEKIWGHDLRVAGVMVEELGGADDLVGAVAAYAPGPHCRLGVLLDHLVPGSKESRLAAQVAAGPSARHVLVLGHPYVDVWAAVRPSVLGLPAWPDVPRGVPWKVGVLAALGWRMEPSVAWARILGSVQTYVDLEPALLGRVEELVDFVTAES